MKSSEKSLYERLLQEEGISSFYMPTALPKPADNLNLQSTTITSEETIPALRKEVENCRLCPELASTRHSTVFGSGNLKARLMFIGEAPGREEDEQGLPFVGAAGQLLTKIIEAINLRRDDVFIANVLKCRPPQNRPPKPEEILNCSSFLSRQISLINPKIICALGTHAAQTLLKTTDPISHLRGRFYDFGGIKLIATYHPAYLLRNPGEKRKVWEDMKMIKQALGDLQ